MNNPLGSGKQDKVRIFNTAFSFRHRGLIGLALLLPPFCVLVLSHPAIVEGGFLDVATDCVGWLLFTAYATFRLWATLYIGGRKDRILLMSGPYSMTRNPLYFGSFCLALSGAFFCKSLILIGAVLILGYIYSRWIVVSEEQFLESIFGEEYKKYCRRVPRFIPNLFLYSSNKYIQVEVRPLEKEAKRILGAALLAIGLQMLTYLRTLSWWPSLIDLF